MTSLPRKIAIGEFDFLQLIGRFLQVDHGDMAAVLGQNIVFAYQLCPLKKQCEFCTAVRLRIKSRVNDG
jgi:hypothetical protein